MVCGAVSSHYTQPVVAPCTSAPGSTGVLLPNWATPSHHQRPPGSAWRSDMKKMSSFSRGLEKGGGGGERLTYFLYKVLGKKIRTI